MVWTSLEIVKLLVSFTTPIVIVLLGIWINKRLKSLEQLQWANQKLIEKRLYIYEEIVPKLNDILCYFTYIGCWKDLEPKEVVSLKRKVDKLAHVYSPLFSNDFLKTYGEFINLCFETYSGWSSDAKLRTQFERRVEANNQWNPEWEIYFSVTDKISDPELIKSSYFKFVKNLSNEIGIGLIPESVKTGAIPYNIDIKTTEEIKEFDDLGQFRQQLEEKLHENRLALEGPYKNEINSLLRLSSSEIDRVTANMTDLESYEALIDIVTEASNLNLSQAELKNRIENLGQTAVNIAKQIPYLARLFE